MLDMTVFGITIVVCIQVIMGAKICPEKFELRGAVCYRYFPDEFTDQKAHDQAVLACQELGVEAKLAEPRSEEENRYLSAMSLPWFPHIVIGITDRQNEGVFRYSSTGQVVSYTNWESPPKANRTNNCVKIHILSMYRGDRWDWINYNCRFAHAFVCQTQPVDDTPVNVKINIRDEVSIRTGDSLSVKCSATPKETVVKWFFKPEHGVETEVTKRGGNMYKKIFVRVRFGVLRLTVKEMDTDAAGTFTCEGENNGKRDSKSFKLTVFVGMSLKSKTEQFGKAGQTGRIECIVEAKPPAVITWWKTKYITSDEDKYIVTKDALIIKNLVKEDEGTYECMADQEEYDDFKEYKIKFYVVEAPVIESLTTDPADAIIGHSISIHCQTSNVYPKPEITFKRGDVDVDGDKVSEGVYTIEKLTQQDEDTYTCKADNIGGGAYKTIQLDVKVPASIRIGKKLEGPGNHFVELVCTARGDPVPFIVWRKGDTTYTEGVTTTDEMDINNGELKQVISVLSLTLSQELRGYWSCYAYNGVGDQAHKQVHTEVYFEGCENGFSIFGHHCYKYLPDVKNYSNAKTSCERLGSELPVPEDAWENDELAAYGDSVNSGDIWLGGDLSTQVLMWVDWQTGQPNRSGFCLQLSDKKWDDVRCDSMLPAICRKHILEPDYGKDEDKSSYAWIYVMVSALASWFLIAPIFYVLGKTKRRQELELKETDSEAESTRKSSVSPKESSVVVFDSHTSSVTA